jgi:hypothetical protein
LRLPQPVERRHLGPRGVRPRHQRVERLIFVDDRGGALVGDVVVGPRCEARGLVELRLGRLVAVLRVDEKDLCVRDSRSLLSERDRRLGPYLDEALHLHEVSILVVERLLRHADELLHRTGVEVGAANRERHL